jgi:hypothetical protein
MDQCRTNQLGWSFCAAVSKAFCCLRPAHRASDYFNCAPEEDLTLVEVVIGVGRDGCGWGCEGGHGPISSALWDVWSWGYRRSSIG